MYIAVAFSQCLAVRICYKCCSWKSQNWTIWRVFQHLRTRCFILIFWPSHDRNLNVVVRNARCASLSTVRNYNEVPFCIWGYLENEELLWGSTIYSLYSLNHEKIISFLSCFVFLPSCTPFPFLSHAAGQPFWKAGESYIHQFFQV